MNVFAEHYSDQNCFIQNPLTERFRDFRCVPRYWISKKKRGKKARKQLDSEQRATWAFSPVTKKVESKKLYNRKRKAHDRYDDYGMGFSQLYPSIIIDLYHPISTKGETTEERLGNLRRHIIYSDCNAS